MVPPMDSDDARLLRDCLDGKPGAWEAFVAAFTPFLRTVCRHALQRYSLSAGPQEVEDMLQEIFIVFLAEDLRVLKAYRGDADPASYLAIVAVHRVSKERAPPSPSPPAEPVSQAPGPGEALEARAAGEALNAALADLSSTARLALVLHAEGASLRAIGQALGVSKDVVAGLLQRAKRSLRQRLKPENS